MTERANAFGRIADEYERGRPGYPRELLRQCVPFGARRVLDLAAGTGKLARELEGVDVVAVEPAPELRALIPEGIEVLSGTAESIPLADDSVDAVLVGQAFHWFDQERALGEMRRVTRPGGTFALLWNLVDDRSGWPREYADLLRLEDRASDRLDEPLMPGERRLEVAHIQRLDADGLVANAASRSTVALLAPAERAALLQRVRALAPQGEFELPYVCYARIVPA